MIRTWLCSWARPRPTSRCPAGTTGRTGSFSLAAERGHPVVLAFYPGDERLVCTRQMCAYSDSVADLHLFDAVVWGISPHDVDSHRSFAQGRRLKMPLLSRRRPDGRARVRRDRPDGTAPVGVRRGCGRPDRLAPRGGAEVSVPVGGRDPGGARGRARRGLTRSPRLAGRQDLAAAAHPGRRQERLDVHRAGDR